MKIILTITLLVPDKGYQPDSVREAIQEKLSGFCGPLVKVDVALTTTEP